MESGRRLRVFPADFVVGYIWTVPFLTVWVFTAVREKAIVGALDHVQP